MDNSSPSPFATPKRKRIDVVNEEAPSPLNTHFSFEVSHGLLPDGSGSPRTSVAHRFRGLALADTGSGGGVAADGRHELHATDTMNWVAMEIDGDESKMRKRTKLSPVPSSSPGTQKPADRIEAPETPSTPRGQHDTPADLGSGPLQHPLAPANPDDVPLKPDSPVHSAIDPAVVTSSPKHSQNKFTKLLQTANNRAVEALKPKSRKRAGTPPLVASTIKTGNADQSGDSDAEIVDPVRAALTWHEDEITVYDPEDDDDDGTGINGIGFKPTPAIAYARIMKRKQQLAEYKKREDKEARARRSSRRRGSPDRVPKLDRKPSARKVRFMDADPTTMITI